MTGSLSDCLRKRSQALSMPTGKKYKQKTKMKTKLLLFFIFCPLPFCIRSIPIRYLLCTCSIHVLVPILYPNAGFFWVVLNVRWQWVQTLANRRGGFSRINANYRKGTWIQSALVVSFHLFFIKVVHLSQMAGTLGNCCLIPFSKLQSWSIIMCLTLES